MHIGDRRKIDITLYGANLSNNFIYQRYYLIGLEKYAKIKLSTEPNISRPVPGIKNKLKVLFRTQKFFRKFGKLIGRTLIKPDQYPCRLKLSTLKGERKFVIDPRDVSSMLDNETLEWSEIYFKSNKWKTKSYPQKVHPIVNGNGILTESKINFLKSLREKSKSIDISHISRVWEGGEEAEHNVKIFESLSKLSCSKDLTAIFMPRSQFRDKEKYDGYWSRLEKAGVVCTDRHLAPHVLWEKLARTKLVFSRPGRYLCIPWRMVDLLCLGACIVNDSAPFPVWPIPLEKGINYLDCEIANSPNDDPYLKLPSIIEYFLREASLIKKIRQNNIRYFEEHASPDSVAKYILKTLL